MCQCFFINVLLLNRSVANSILAWANGSKFSGQCFGGNTSAQNFEPLAHARILLATDLFNNKSLIKKHWHMLKHVKFVADINKCLNLSQAHTYSKNHGAIRNGIYTNSEHHMSVDDNLIAEIHDHAMQAMAASIEALFLVLGLDMPTIRRSTLSMEKFYQSICPYKNHNLAYPSIQEQ